MKTPVIFSTVLFAAAMAIGLNALGSIRESTEALTRSLHHERVLLQGAVDEALCARLCVLEKRLLEGRGAGCYGCVAADPEKQAEEQSSDSPLLADDSPPTLSTRDRGSEPGDLLEWELLTEEEVRTLEHWNSTPAGAGRLKESQLVRGEDGSLGVLLLENESGEPFQPTDAQRQDFEDLAWYCSESNRLLLARPGGVHLSEVFRSPEMRDIQSRLKEGKARLGVKGHAKWLR